MTLHLLLSLMAFLTLANGRAQRRPPNWIPQPTQLTPDYSETDPKDLSLNRQLCECSPEPRSQNRMLSQSETKLPKGKDYQFSSPWGGNNSKMAKTTSSAPTTIQGPTSWVGQGRQGVHILATNPPAGSHLRGTHLVIATMLLEELVQDQDNLLPVSEN